MDNTKIILSLKKSLLCKGLSYEQCSFLFQELKPEIRSLEKDQVIYHENDCVTRFGLVVEGVIVSSKSSISGRETINHFCRANHYFALEFATSNANRSLYEYKSKEKSLVCLFDYKGFVQSSIDATVKDILAANFVDLLAINSRKNSERIELLEQNSLRQRVLLYLEMMSRRKGSTHFFDCKNREEMAAYLSVNRSALSNELRKMKEENLIDFQKNEFWLQKNS